MSSPGHDTPRQELHGDTHRHLVDEVCRRVNDLPGSASVLARAEVDRLAPLLPPDQQRALAGEVLARLTGLGELAAHLRDPAVDEVLVNAGGAVWLDRGGVLQRAATLEPGRVEQLLERLLAPLGRRVDRSSPIVDARLADGARVCAVLPPVAVDGPTLSVRRFAERIRPLHDFTDGGCIELLTTVLHAACNIVVSGATSSGKTSLVSALVAQLPPAERLVIVEDTAELAVSPTAHAVRLEARPPSVDGPPPIDLGALVRTALRLRPDRIVVGEVRGDEVLALVQAMNTGHDGSIATVHANGALDALFRLESLVLQAAPAWPLAAIRTQLARSIDVVVHVERRLEADRQRRVVAAIHEVCEPRDDGAPATRVLAQRHGSGRTSPAAPLQRRRR